VTERLYYHDSFVKEFEAQVVSCEPEAERWKIVLDRTAFYPTSGGQPHDLGSLGAASIVEVSDAETHIVHYASAALPLGKVRGKIDWPRRFDHMQQHTAQHLLSAAFIELFGVPTVSFHLGAEICTIDLKAPSLTQRQLEQAERRTNEIIFEDRVVSVRFGTAEELAVAGVRKSVDRVGVLRAVEIDRMDLQPCGGTHLSRTGQAGMILIRKLERRRDEYRVEFVAGNRALETARADYATLTQAAAALTCGLPEVSAVVAKIIEERRTQHSARRNLEDRLADFEATALIRGGEDRPTPDGHPRVIVGLLEDASPSYLTLLAARITGSAAGAGAARHVIAFLGSRTSGHVALAQSKGSAGDLGANLREALKRFGGKGGGGKDFAQAVLGDPAKVPDFLDHLKMTLSANG
jgi:alanyl-tRNA synthetase